MAITAISLTVVLGETPSCKWVHAESANKVLWVPFLVERVDTAASNSLAASRTERSCLLMVMDLAVWLASELEECASSKTLLAVLAHKMFRMPLLSNCIDAFTLDGLIATSAPSRKHTVEAPLTIWARVPFEERSALKRLQALGAYEVIHVPFLSQGCDASVQNRLVAMGTAGAEKLLVAPLAVGHIVLLVEIGSAERVLAIAAREMLRMEGLPQCLNHLTQNRLSANLARASGRRCIGIDGIH